MGRPKLNMSDLNGPNIDLFMHLIEVIRFGTAVHEKFNV